MIDFRYHLVSIASVFLALAVGIVLGAGPLKGTLGDTLAGEVAQLRADANTLRSDLSAAEASVDARDEIVSELRSRSVTGLLSGATVSVLALPGSEDSVVDAVRVAITEAGAAVGADVRLESAWSSEDPPEMTDRSTAAADLREEFAGDLPVGIDPDRVLALTLGWALASDPTARDDEPSAPQTAEPAATDPADPDGDSPGSDSPGSEDADADGTSTDSDTGVGQGGGGDSARILQIMADNGLLTITGESAPDQTDAVVVVTPAPGDVAAADVSSWRELVAAIDESGAVVVAGNITSGAEIETDLLATVRDDGNLSGQISTLDNLLTPVGGAALPFVVSEQLTQVSGHYGELDTASRLFPPVPMEGEE